MSRYQPIILPNRNTNIILFSYKIEGIMEKFCYDSCVYESIDDRTGKKLTEKMYQAVMGLIKHYMRPYLNKHKSL